MQASVSLVFVVVIDWTRMGESLPIVTLPTWVVVVCLRCMVYGGVGACLAVCGGCLAAIGSPQ